VRPKTLDGITCRRNDFLPPRLRVFWKENSEKGFIAAVFAMEGNFNQLRSVAQPDDNTDIVVLFFESDYLEEFSPEFFLSCLSQPQQLLQHHNRSPPNFTL
jgi:hypothetical protein